MFNNRKDPLIDSVKKVMAENETRRQAELDLNEELGIASKRALPHEHHANYDALLEQKIAEALHPNQQKLDVHEPEKDNLTAQDFKMLRAKKKPKVNEVIMAPGDTDDTADQIAKKLDQLRSNAMPTGTPEDGSKTISDIIGRMKINNAMKTFNSGLKNVKEAIGDKEGTAGTLRKNGKPVVPDTTANNPYMQASPDKAPMPPERPKDLDKQAPTPPARPKDLNEISRNLARMVIRKASDEKEMGSKKDRSKAVVMAGKKAYSIPSEPKVRATNEETIEENHVLYTHPKADIKVVRKGEGSKEGAAIEVHKGGKKVASGDYDHGADAFFVNVGGKGQKSFDSAKDIANHFHGMSEQFQQIDEMAPKGAKYERMVKHIKDKYSKDGKLSDKEKSIAYATAWKAKNKNMEEGLTSEQVMAEIRKNLGEDKFNEVNEAGGVMDRIKDTVSNIGTGIKNALTPTPNNTVPDPEGTVERPGQAAQSRMAPVSTVSSTPNVSNLPKTDTMSDAGERSANVSNLPKQSTTSDAGEKPATSSNRAAEMGNDSRSQAKPNVDKNVPTGGAPAAGAAALTKQTPKPAPSAAKPTAPAAAKDDIWDDSKIQRTGRDGEETPGDFQRNSELYNKRNAAGGQRPAPEAPKPATPSASRPATPSASRPATPSAGSPNNPMTNSPDGPAPKMTNPTAERGSGGNMAAGRAAERGTDSRTQVPASRILAGKTKMNESLNDAITKILKG